MRCGTATFLAAYSILTILARPVAAYSVLAHETIIDAAWEDRIQPLLKRRFPDVTADQLLEAHAAAYGGCLAADMGYYPFGDRFFSDLLHYVKTGDFVQNMLRDATTASELAFALGMLGHYVSDTVGHPTAVNVSVPVIYPKLARKFGKSVTYEDEPSAHMKVEFGFDVLQVARGNYAPKAYHDFIGFRIEYDLLARAFKETYGLELDSVIKHKGFAFGTLRYAVGTLVPNATKAAWQMKKKDIVQAQPSMTARRFRYNLSRTSFEKEWGKQYDRPGFGSRVILFLARIMPKIGPFRALAFKLPAPETEKLFMASFNSIVDRYRAEISGPDLASVTLPNVNLDTGLPASSGKYWMAEKTEAELNQRLHK